MSRNWLVWLPVLIHSIKISTMAVNDFRNDILKNYMLFDSAGIKNTLSVRGKIFVMWVTRLVEHAKFLLSTVHMYSNVVLWVKAQFFCLAYTETRLMRFTAYKRLNKFHGRWGWHWVCVNEK